MAPVSSGRGLGALLIAISTLGLGGTALAQDAVPGEYLIKMKGRASSQRSAQFVGKISNKASLKATFGKLNMHAISLKAGQNPEQFVESVPAGEDDEYIEPNYILKKFDDEQVDNRLYSIEEAQAMAGSQSGNNYSQSTANTKVSQSWSAMSSSSSEIPVVAIIDTGMDYNNPIFVNSQSLWRNPGEIANNNTDDDGNGYVDDVFGWNFVARNGFPLDDDNHGTHVAGIVLGVGQNIFANPIAIAKIRLMPLKFLGAGGSGSTSDAIQAIYYAVNNGANVINNSWGGSSYSQALHDAMTYAYDRQVVLVSAAGNYSSNNDASPLFPSSYPIPSNIAVAATNDSDVLASFSNYGQSSVQMAAPGVSILSTVPGGTRYMSGTSMAAPFVAGLAALVLREAPQLSGYQVANLVVNSGANFSRLMAATRSGNRADSYESVMSAKTQVNVNSAQPSYSASAVIGGRSLASETSSPGGGCGTVSLLGAGGAARAFQGPQDPPIQSLLLVVALALVPMAVYGGLRLRTTADASGKNRRRHERFVMNSEIKVKIGDRELVGMMNTISVGGASFKADAMLERGGIVTLQIAGPDGGEQIQVEGTIVWNEANQSYGVQFQDQKQDAIESIQGWTNGLSKAN